jgi:hypothetical protein
MYTDDKFYLKMPKNLKVSFKAQKNYAHYLWFKSMNRFGIIKKSELKNNKNKAYYWSKKLISQGWMKDCGDHFQMAKYQVVWDKLKVKRVNKRKGVIGYAYFRLVNEGTPKEIFESIQRVIIERSKNQIAFRLSKSCTKSIKQVKKLFKPECSGQCVASMLGYSSKHTGWKYRRKYMKVIKPDVLYTTINTYAIDGIAIDYKRYHPYMISLD